ncbi:hypothetical protein ACHAXA_009748 [Cyclostephanos tholiformis]|uniref:Uncharacterized protein n=1 Tax=Cyclostephanos tholiformis TaxID=382380 RepID=A0ABD3SGN9_9STRA
MVDMPYNPHASSSDDYVRMSPSRPAAGWRKVHPPGKGDGEVAKTTMTMTSSSSSSDGATPSSPDENDPSRGIDDGGGPFHDHRHERSYSSYSSSYRRWWWWSWHDRRRALDVVAIATTCAALLAFGSYLVVTIAIKTTAGGRGHRISSSSSSIVSVAFVGNSMFYFNDFPRFFEDMCNGNIVQNSCLHGGASIGSLASDGNAMHPQFMTTNAILGNDDDGHTLYDYGACTVRQLLSGEEYYHYDTSSSSSSSSSDVVSNNTNPCRVDVHYREYANAHFGITGGDDGGVGGGWDYVVINDNTRYPARKSTRELSLITLEGFYLPLLLRTGSIPVFLWTHAYTYRNACGGGGGDEYRATTSENSHVDDDDDDDVVTSIMAGLDDISNFTSLTLVGYRAYVDLLGSRLPSHQAPRIAPVGLAFLVVYEEDYELWTTLFHCDNIHASPSGSFLQGCIVYYTLFGNMPDEGILLREDVSSLWDRARVMQHSWEPSNQFPDQETARYLYRVAERVMIEGHVPSSFINYQNGEAAADIVVR